jgi:hypothetical protein
MVFIYFGIEQSKPNGVRTDCGEGELMIANRYLTLSMA